MKRKNILLVYPKFPKNTYWSMSYALEFIGKRSNTPPLGLITVAAMISDDYNLKLVDMNIEELKDEHLEWADLVCTSTMICQKDSLIDVVSRSKQKGLKVVAGGPYPTQYYEDMPDVDYFLIGEAESGILDAFFEDYEKGTAKRAYARHTIRKNEHGNVIDSDEWNNLNSYFSGDSDLQIVEEKPCMDLSPIPRFDLLDVSAYASMALQLSRGCPHNCDFCNEPTLFGNKPRLKTAEKMIKEVSQIYDMGYRGSVFIVDDNFIGNRVKVKEVLRELKKFQEERGYPFLFYTEADITLSLDCELMSLMRGAGFNMVFVGLESPSKEVLRSMGKQHNVAIELLPAVKKIQSYGMEVTGGFIVGNDADPPDICEKIFDFCQEAGIVTAMVGMLTAMKGSALYERMKKEGRLLGDSEGNNTHAFETNFISKNPKVSHEYKILMERLYDKTGKNYFARSRVLFDNLGWSPKPTNAVTKPELMALKKSIMRQLLSGKCKINYAKFLIKTSIKDFARFPEAVSKAVFYHHFKKITRDALDADKFYNPKNISKYLHSEMEIFRDNFYNAWSSNLENGSIAYKKAMQRIKTERKQFLIRLKKKCEVLPGSYRRRLIRLAKKNLSFYINNLKS